MKLDDLPLNAVEEIRDKINNWPASRLNAKAIRDDCRVLLGVIDRQNHYLNTPEYEDFASGVVSEARHQLTVREEDDKLKEPKDWFWTLGYLAGKALSAANAHDWQKVKHHLITSAALLNNWHRTILEAERADMPPLARPGETPEQYARRMAGL